MMTFPNIANVADLQRRYRQVVNQVKKTGIPTLVVNNGKPDVVLMDLDNYQVQASRLQELEELYLSQLTQKALSEYRAGKTTHLKKGQTLLDLIS